MTITDTPTHQAKSDEAQVLFEEARQRRKRRRLMTGITALIVVVMALGITIGLLVSRGGGSARPVVPAGPAPSAAAVAAKVSFSIRPVICYAPPYAVPAGQAPSTGPLPACSPATQLSASNLEVTPDGGNVNGYTSNSNVNADPQFATYPSTTSSNDKQSQEVLLPGTATSGSSGRYVLGPAGLTRTAIGSARAISESGQWTVRLGLTPNGSVQWDSLVAQQFHAIVGVVIDGRVVSAPITQPTQQAFTSFDGQLQISGGFTEYQAKVIASEL
jgi:predicted nucleic acid-binding Zn ribbon protein